MKQKIVTSWKGGMKFESDVQGHKLMVDSAPDFGGDDAGPTPKILMLVALAGCTGMDAISILKKMRVDVEGFDISVEANMREEHPKYYDEMHVVYEFTGKDLPMAKLEKAVMLSKERYCGVEAVYKQVMEMTHEIRVIDTK